MAIKKRPVPAKLSKTLKGADLAEFHKATGVILQSIATQHPVVHLLTAALDNDADEIILRVGQFNPDLSTANYQAIVRFSDRTRAIACKVSPDPYQALVAVLQEAASEPNPNKKVQNASEDTAGILRKRPDSRIKRLARKPRTAA